MTEEQAGADLQVFFKYRCVHCRCLASRCLDEGNEKRWIFLHRSCGNFDHLDRYVLEDRKESKGADGSFVLQTADDVTDSHGPSQKGLVLLGDGVIKRGVNSPRLLGIVGRLEAPETVIGEIGYVEMRIDQWPVVVGGGISSRG